jgi:hypothetical protein
MVWYVFTASHLDCQERISHLRELIESVRQFPGLKHCISISADKGIEIPKLGLSGIRQKSKQSQFKP